MQKMSSEQVSQVLSQVGPTLRGQQEKIQSLEAERQELTEKLAHYQKRERAEKIASKIHAKGLSPDASFGDTVDNLMEKNLDVVEEAVEMSAPQIKLASLSDTPGNASDAKSAFEAAILD